MISQLVTIVIPCKNEGLNLIKTIESIKFNSTIVVSDSSDDNTIEILLSRFPNVKVVKGGLPSIARNSGFKLVETPYVLFLDADMDISNVNIEKMINFMITRDIDLSTCRISSPGRYWLAYRIFNLIQNIISKKTPFAVGGFMLFKTSKFKEIGGFNEEDRFAEDYHLSMKIDPNKFKIFSDVANTSDRRFRNKSVLYMIKLMVRCWFNRNDENFYKKDYDYWL
jgi:glycosyltransferase involved in cell wall biosynthesis